MVERVDSVHIKIKIDVDPQDKEFIEGLASEMGRADQERAKRKNEPNWRTYTEEEKPKKKKKEEFIGPPTRTEFEQRKVEKLLDDIKRKRKLKKEKRTPEQILKDKEQQLNSQIRKEIMQNPVFNLSKEAASTLAKIATKPGEVLTMVLSKALGRFGGVAMRGGLYAIIALLAYETAIFAIKQLMEPGRWLDRRYRRIARVETMNFYERTLQEDLRHGYQEMRVTTIQGLRGGAGQVNGNLFEFSSGPTGILQSSPYRSSQQIYGHAYLSGSGVDKRGNPKRRTVSGRFG